MNIVEKTRKWVDSTRQSRRNSHRSDADYVQAFFRQLVEEGLYPDDTPQLENMRHYLQKTRENRSFILLPFMSPFMPHGHIDHTLHDVVIPGELKGRAPSFEHLMTLPTFKAYAESLSRAGRNTLERAMTFGRFTQSNEADAQIAPIWTGMRVQNSHVHYFFNSIHDRREGSFYHASNGDELVKFVKQDAIDNPYKYKLLLDEKSKGSKGQGA